MKAKTNLTMLCDFYELTMANGYFQTGLKDRICYFDVFYRSVPDKGGFSIAAGLAQVVEYIQDLTFDEEDVEYLRGKGCFSEEFLDFLRDFRRMAFFVPCAVMALLDLVFIVCSDLFDRILRHEGQGVSQTLQIIVDQDEFVVFNNPVFHGWLPSA